MEATTQMTTYDACSIVEGFCGYEPTELEQLKAWAHLIKVGAAWTLQGWYGRNAAALIEAGYIDNNGQILIEL
jgi:hypothetical protein